MSDVALVKFRVFLLEGSNLRGQNRGQPDAPPLSSRYGCIAVSVVRELVQFINFVLVCKFA